MSLDVNKNVDKKIIFHRDERIYLEGDIPSKITLKIGEQNKDGKILDISRFGAKFKLNDEESPLCKESLTLKNVSINIFNMNLFNGNGKIAYYHNTEENCYGIQLFEEINIEKLKTHIKIEKYEKDSFCSQNLLNNISKISSEFKILTSDLHVALQNVRDFLLQKEKDIDISMSTSKDISSAKEFFLNIALKEYTSILRNYFQQMTILVKNLTPEVEKLYRFYFMKTMHPITLGAGFIKQGFTKPLGYAGDFKLMTMLYDYEDIGGDLFQKFFHRFTCNEPAAVANKNRVVLLSKILCEESSKREYNDSYKVTSIACGPAREIELFLENRIKNNNQNTIINCIDQEPKAIDHASKRIRKIATDNVKTNFICEEAVLNIIRNAPFTKLIFKSNCIISAGLFDYLNDKISSKLIGKLFDMLEINGLLIIGNVANPNPDFFSMNYFMNWKLIERSKEDLLNLLNENNMPSKDSYTASVISEELDLNLFLVIRKIKN